MKSMLGLILHGLKNKSIFSATIGVFELTESHTADYISDVLSKILSQYNITDEKIVAIITDNGANIVKAKEQQFGKHKHVPCFAHTLNLVCENALRVPQVKDLVTKCRDIVTWMKRHVNANDELRKMQASSGIPEGKMLKLLLDVRDLYSYMLQRFIVLLPYISQILLNHVDAPPMISSKENEEMTEIISLLRPLEAMTRQISGQQYATLSQIIPLVNCGREQIHKIICHYEIATKLKHSIIYEFERRFDHAEKSFLLAASTLLDPRFKKIHFNDPLALSSLLKNLRSLRMKVSTVLAKHHSLVQATNLICGQLIRIYFIKKRGDQLTLPIYHKMNWHII